QLPLTSSLFPYTTLFRSKGKIELEFSLTPTQWQNPARRKQYYRSIDRLVTKVGRQLLADFGNQLSGREKEAFMRALHTLAWQESDRKSTRLNSSHVAISY